MLKKLKKLNQKEKLLLISLLDAILFDRSVDRIETCNHLFELLVVAEWSEKEIKAFLESEFKNDFLETKN